MEDKRNIIDVYKYWTVDAIKADLDKKRHNFTVVCVNLANDFNIGSIIRNANAFLAKEVILIGRKRWDRRGAVGTHNYLQFNHVKTVDDFATWLKTKKLSSVVAIDNVPDAQPIREYIWSSDYFETILVFGQEDTGIPEDILKLCPTKLYIPQHGSVRSLNVGCASAIAMYEYTSKVARYDTHPTS